MHFRSGRPRQQAPPPESPLSSGVLETGAHLGLYFPPGTAKPQFCSPSSAAAPEPPLVGDAKGRATATVATSSRPTSMQATGPALLPQPLPSPPSPAPGPPPGSLKRLFFVQFRFVSRLGSRSCHFLWFSQPLSSSTSSAPRFPFCAAEATLLRPTSPASFACVPGRPLGSPLSVSSLTRRPSSQVCSLLLRGRPARSDLPVFSQLAPGTSGDVGGGHAAPPPHVLLSPPAPP